MDRVDLEKDGTFGTNLNPQHKQDQKMRLMGDKEHEHPQLLCLLKDQMKQVQTPAEDKNTTASLTAPSEDNHKN